MALEPTVNVIADLDSAVPSGQEPKYEGDDHLRNIKKALRTLLTAVPGAATRQNTALSGSTLATPVRACTGVLPSGTATTASLTNIALTSIVDGGILLLTAGDVNRVVTIIHNENGIGPIHLREEQPFALNHADRIILLQRQGSVFKELIRFYEGIPPSLGTINTWTAAQEFESDVTVHRSITSTLTLRGLRTDLGSIARHSFYGINAAATLKEYAALVAASQDRTVGSEDGQIELQTMRAGAAFQIELKAGGGITLGGATGGAPGFGKLNAVEVQQNGSKINPAPFVYSLAAGAWSWNSVITQPHGLGGVPNEFFLEFVNTITDQGIDPGYRTRFQNGHGVSVFVDSTNIKAVIDVPVIRRPSDQTSADLDVTDWDLRLVAYRRPE